MFGNKKRLEQKLTEEGGAVAWATVIDSATRWTSGPAFENRPGMTANKHHMKVTLRVEPEGQPPFETTFHQTFPGTIPIKGFQAKVVYDPEDHAKVAILEDQIFPPGISHEKAARVAERRKRFAEAARTGNIAQVVQEDIAAAQVVASSVKVDLADELTKLADLRDRGVLTEAEFAAQKAKLLAAS